MALVPTGTPIYYPSMDGAGNASVVATFGTFDVGTIGFKVGSVFQSPVTDTITHIAFRTAALNAGDLEVRVETFDTSTGLPTGTLWAANTSGTRTMIASDDNQYFEVALTSPASVNVGDFVCLIVQSASATMGTLAHTIAAAKFTLGFPVALQNAGSTSYVYNAVPTVTPKFGTAGYTYISGFNPIETMTTRTYNNTSTPDVRGNKLTVPYKCTVNGVWISVDSDAAHTIHLLASDGSTSLGTIAGYTNVPPSTAGLPMIYKFATPINLNANDVVYLVVEPTTASNISVYERLYDSADIKAVWCSNVVAVSAKDPTSSASYTEVSTSAYSMGLEISAIDNGTPATAANPIKGYIA